MQPDAASRTEYDPLGRFERGESRGPLTRTDRRSWQDKSWVVGLRAGGVSKAYDWDRLKQERVINDVVGETPSVLALAADEMSFVAFERPADERFNISNDTLLAGRGSYDLAGHDLAVPSQALRAIPASQEFWHSWRTFHPGTLKY